VLLGMFSLGYCQEPNSDQVLGRQSCPWGRRPNSPEFLERPPNAENYHPTELEAHPVTSPPPGKDGRQLLGAKCLVEVIW
jgi:hypothetical protein